MSRRAFTLIELLVVIAIVAILAAILFPVLAQAKAAAKKTACVSNAKQMGMVYMLYEGDYDDVVPMRQWTDGTTRWPLYTVPTYAKTTSKKKVEQIVFCPSTIDDRPDSFYEYMFSLTPAYGFNYYYLNTRDTTTGAYLGISATSVAAPSDTILFAESVGVVNGAVSFDKGYFYTEPPARVKALSGGNVAFGRPVARHMERGAAVFCDGHVKMLADRDGSGTFRDEAIWDIQ